MSGLVNPGGTPRFTAPKASATHVGALKGVVRSAQGLDADAAVLVQQLTCTEPGCPPTETVVAVLSPPRRTWKLAMAVADIAAETLRATIAANPEGITHAHD